ncbi:hypothetical protein FKV68_30270 (plasmid) [Sinorhizobium mexicanum]|uniref:Uncharacterized protein n=1 Tax=Sinorhizobium mexicanum TaxID=375549 RepID=A0A859QSC2_9HYPH|nr:hypothetical protein FKV68_30270 [Sinorhizobium mexicanum]
MRAGSCFSGAGNGCRFPASRPAVPSLANRAHPAICRGAETERCQRGMRKSVYGFPPASRANALESITFMIYVDRT